MSQAITLAKRAVTDLLDLTGWPPRLRIIVRREPVHLEYGPVRFRRRR